jgi:hypothetical protein
VEAREDLDQDRLARAVLSEQSVHLAAPNGQIDVVQCANTPERLRDVPERDDRLVLVRSRSKPPFARRTERSQYGA